MQLAETPTNTIEKTSELEEVLHHQQNIADRLFGFEKRLCSMSLRLSGDRPCVDDNEAPSSEVDRAGGLIGQFQETHAATQTRCDAIAEWLDILESTV